MPYDEEVAQRFRDAIGHVEDLSEKRMMGGLCFLLNGNMIGGADRTKSGVKRLLFRVGKDNDAEAATMKGAQSMIQGGRRMSGFYFVDEGTCDDAMLDAWMKLAVGFVLELPPK